MTATDPKQPVARRRQLVRRIDLICILFLMSMLSSSIGVADVPASDEEVVYSIFEYDIEYQEKARAVVADMMYHWPEESYVRWRPVRVEPREILQKEILSDSAMPASLQLTVFPDTVVSAQRTRYAYIEATGGAIWEGVIPGNELSRVEITVEDMTDKLANTEERIAFVIRIWDPPRHFSVIPTRDLDIYVAVEGRVVDDTYMEWAPVH